MALILTLRQWTIQYRFGLEFLFGLDFFNIIVEIGLALVLDVTVYFVVAVVVGDYAGYYVGLVGVEFISLSLFAGVNYDFSLFLYWSVIMMLLFIPKLKGIRVNSVLVRLRNIRLKLMIICNKIIFYFLPLNYFFA